MQTNGFSRVVMVTLASAGVVLAQVAPAQGWKPERNVELTIPTSPGGSNDIAGRIIHKLWTELKLLPVPSTVVNRSGGEHIVAYTYISQRTGDAHAIGVMSTPMLVNPIEGRTSLTHNDVTPIAYLITEPMIAVVRADSPIKTGKDLVARLRQDPKSVTIGFSPLLGSHNHIAAGLLMKTIGGNARDLKVVAYKGSADAIPNLMGGHIDLVTTAAGNVAGHVANGKLRVVAITADRRLPGALADVPTWKEQGVNHVFGAWRAIFAPKGLTAQQTAYWEGALRKATEAPEWKADLEKNIWADAFLAGEAFKKDLDQDYAEMKAVLGDIGLAK